MNLKEIFKPIFTELQLVKRHLNRTLETLHTSHKLSDDQKKHVVNVMNHFFNPSGKGLRPALALLTAKLVGKSGESDTISPAVIQFATAVELLHSASLAHDDVLDKAKFRRRQMSLNEKFGSSIAVVVGDVFLMEAFSLMFNLETADLQKKEKVFHIVQHTLEKMFFFVFFEHHRLKKQGTADVGEYEGIIEKKTASLLSACCECSAVLVGQVPEIHRQMADFGRNIGIAFQAADDLKDQDAPVNDDVDLVSFVKTYVQKAKSNLSPFHNSAAKTSLMGLCDILLPTLNSLCIFDQTPE